MATARKKTKRVGTRSTAQGRRRKLTAYDQAFSDLKDAFVALKESGVVHPTELKAVVEEVNTGLQGLTLFREHCK